MPIQENLGASPSENGTKNEKPLGMSVKEALATARQNTAAMPEPTRNEMSKSEALAVAWTGLEALAMTKQAYLYRSPRTGRVWIELVDVDYETANGLVSIGNEVHK